MILFIFSKAFIMVTEKRYRYIPVLLLCMCIAGIFCATDIRAQNASDTLRLSLPDAEKIFMEKNLSLLAAKYNIDINKALTEQAKLWDNPVLVTDQNIYADHAFFAHGKDANGQLQGQYFIQVQQLIKTAGKRSKWVAMAETNTKLSELGFNEVMRNLKYRLRTDFYTISKLSSVHSLYQGELFQLQFLLAGMEAQLKAGNIAQKDYLRIRALIYSMQQDAIDNDRQLADAETDLKNLLQVNGNAFINPFIKAGNPVTADDLRLDDLLVTAKQYNSAYKMQQLQLLYQQQNLGYQKALRSADLAIGPEYDHNSNYAPHYVGLSISLPLNIFNKNQGNIKAAQFSVKQQETAVNETELELNNAVQNAMSKWLLTVQLSSRQEQDFYAGYETLFKNMMDSYRSRQISLIEFIDSFDAYRDTRLQWLQQQLNLQLAKEELNYLAGKDVVN